MVEPKPPTFQASEITVRDWKNVSHDIASEMAAIGLVPLNWPRGIDNGAPGVPLRPVFVNLLAPNSIFLREAADELEADILRRGGTLTHSPAGATVVSLDVDVVRWAPDGLGWAPDGFGWAPGVGMRNTEAVSKVSVEINDRLVMKLVDPLYVRGGDIALYTPAQPLQARLLRYEP
jgi:hypothetical protein